MLVGRRRPRRPSGTRGVRARDVRRGRRAAATRVSRDCADHRRRELAVGPHQPLQRVASARRRAARRLRASSAASIASSRPRRRRPRCSPTSSWWRCRSVFELRDLARRRRRGRRSRRRSRRRCRRRRRRPACRWRRRRARWPASRWRRPGRTAASARPVDSLGHRRGQHLHQVARRADRVELRVHVLEQQRAGAPALGRRRDDHRVAALERVDDLVGRRRRRVGRRRDRADHADRPRDLDDAARRSSAMTPTDCAPCRSRSRPSVLRWFLRILSSTWPMPGVGDRELGERAVAPRLDDGPAAAQTSRRSAPGRSRRLLLRGARARPAPTSAPSPVCARAAAAQPCLPTVRRVRCVVACAHSDLDAGVRGQLLPLDQLASTALAQLPGRAADAFAALLQQLLLDVGLAHDGVDRRVPASR